MVNLYVCTKSIYRHLHKQCGADTVYCLGNAYLYGRIPDFQYPDRFGAQIACQQTFIALGNAKTSVFLALLRKVLLLIPLIFILPQFISNQVLAVFIAEPIADIIAVSTTAILFTREYKRLGKYESEAA